MNGIVKTYYTNGKLETEKGYAMSIEDGVERDYDYESGEITTNRNYKNGVLHGSQIAHYGSNIGDFIQRVTYENGKMTGSFSEIFTDGTIKKPVNTIRTAKRTANGWSVTTFPMIRVSSQASVPYTKTAKL